MIKYRGPKPILRYNYQDLISLGVKHKKQDSINTTFYVETNLYISIRLTCNNKTFAVDLRDTRYTRDGHCCLTTECKTKQEAQNIVYLTLKHLNNLQWNKYRNRIIFNSYILS
jgi:hypothetical protein